MKDRQFTIMLVLVIAAGLVMGLIAFRISGGASADTPVVAGNTAVSNDGQPHPSAADTEGAADGQPADTIARSDDASSLNGEPPVPAKEPPPMQGSVNGDPPGTAATPSPPAGDTPSATLQ